MSLLELILALAIFTLMVLGILVLWETGQDTYFRGAAAAQAQQNIRAALEIMVRDVRQASSIPTAEADRIVFQSILDPAPAPQRTFRIATAAACQGRCLQYERVAGAGFQNLADHILAGGLQFTYRDAAGTAFGTPVSAANLALVQQVDIAVQGQMTWASPDPPFTFLSSVKLRNR